MTATYYVPRDRSTPLAFVGARIAAVDNRNANPDQWTELDIYLVRDGGYVASIAQIATWPSEIREYEAFVVEDADALVRRLGQGALARKAYKQAGVFYASDWRSP